MKYITLFFCLVFFVSCQSYSDDQIKEIEQLRKNNDSLSRVLEDIANKYVFDSISFREIPNPNNTAKLNSEYSLELIVIGYSPDKTYFVKYDSIVDGKKINPDTLRQINGGFKYSTKLESDKNPIWIEMNINNDYGKSKKGTLYDVIKVQ